MTREHLRFPGPSGLLAGRLEAPDGEPAAYALFAHCFACSKDLKAAGHLCRALVAGGIAVLRFDFTGIGESEGELAASSFTTHLDDLAAAADFLRRERQAPRLLIGHSLGGAAVIAAAQRIPEAVAVATLNAPSGTEHLRETLLRRAPELETRGEAEVRLGGQPFRIRRELLDDLCGERVLAAVGSLGRALLVLHSPFDAIVPAEHARRLYDAARHPKSFISLDRADHLLTDPRDASYAGTVIAAWASRYLDPRPGEPEVEVLPVPGAEGDVVVTGGAEGFLQRIRAGRHLLVSDEPESVPGGTGRGPTPYDLLLAGLGACTSMTLGLYARRKGWPLGGVRVKLRHSRIHAADCARCQGQDEKISRIEREVEVSGPLDAGQRARLLEIADRCPVHRTLSAEIDIVTRLAEEAAEESPAGPLRPA